MITLTTVEKEILINVFNGVDNFDSITKALKNKYGVKTIRKALYNLNMYCYIGTVLDMRTFKYVYYVTNHCFIDFDGVLFNLGENGNVTVINE